MIVNDFLKQTLEKSPDKTAIIAADGEVTFRELDKMASAVARMLQDAGIKRGEKVALHFGDEEAIHFEACYFGCLKIGVIPAPLNTRWAKPEKRYVLEHSDAVGFMVGAGDPAEFADLVSGEPVEIEGRPAELKLLHFWAAGAEVPAGWQALDPILQSGPTDYQEPEPPIGSNDPCDLLYTSGTTGMPKGVLTPHANIAGEGGFGNIGELIGQFFGERMLHAVPIFGFTGLHGLVLLNIRAGVTQVIRPKFDVDDFLNSIEQYRPTSLMGVPTMLNLLMKSPRVKDIDASSLQLVFFGAAQMQPDTIKRMMEVWPGVMMLNGYSMTEAGAAGGCFMGPNPEDHLNHPGSVGKPMGGEVIIVDNQGNPLPSGQVGEICFKTDAARRSYYKGEDRTKELWRGGMLHTGDVGYIDSEGYVYITDRMKDMINRGGYNIYALEVEKVLLEHPDILEAAVVGIPHPDLGEDVLAVVVPKPGKVGGEGSLEPKAIYEYCKQHLADYKCPRHVVFLDALPKNAMQKILKPNLRDSYRDLITSSPKYAGQA